MRLPDGRRQILASLLASAAFLAAFFGLNLVWWLALGLAVLVYAALLLLIGRTAPLSEMMLADRVSAADIAAAGRLLSEASARIARSAEQAADADRAALTAMSARLTAIRDHISQDPADYRSTQRFINNYLPRMVSNVEAYVSLSNRATGDSRARLVPLRQGIDTYAQVLTRIDQACLDNDFRALEAEVDALGFQLQRG